MTASVQGSGSTPSCPTGTTTTASELVFVGLGLPRSSGVTVSAGSSYTLGLQDPIQYQSRAATELRIAGTTGSFPNNFTLSGSANWTNNFTLSGSANWTCIAATFR